MPMRYGLRYKTRIYKDEVHFKPDVMMVNDIVDNVNIIYLIGKKTVGLIFSRSKF